MHNSFDNFRYDGPHYDAEYYMKKELERKALRKLGSYTGGALIVTVIIQNAIILSLQLFGLYERYFSDAYFSSAVDILVVVIGMLIPFVAFGAKMKKISGINQPLMLEKPERRLLMLPAVIAGLGFCMLGNIINSFISIFFSNMNVEFTSPEIPMAEGLSGVILTFFRVAITAAIVEELAFRGFVMGNLHFFGDGFAIGISAVVFALVHGNMVQAPFALMAGFALGYLSVKTGTIWTAVIIHLLNNSISIGIYYFSERYDQDQIIGLYSLLLYGTIIVGAFCFMIVSVRTRKAPLMRGGSVLSTGEKIKAYFLSAPMLISIAYMLWVTANYINSAS